MAKNTSETGVAVPVSTPFVLRKKPITKAEAERFELPYTATGLRATGEPGDNGALSDEVGRLVFFLKPLTGRDDKAISDAMMETDGKTGLSKINIGTMSKLKIIASIVATEGMVNEDTGSPVTLFTEEVYDAAPLWILNALLFRVNELNEERETNAGES